ncbi:hypothetical protein FIV42_03250 [Persicimonas caeni]|uniref:Uncharacterized protein n=1 Tax=Persicimonas caeni TaxID=2292766 RepID=A0A4Y6PNA5_PERCE|nr:hypothetical protein [Persicimonas caeni]QDG49788.1 hypothetical protein FIV42_03250 [Persicimonas caeni]QED31009.1 hypothetical protein FRD00_03245 [Persicimonas caeni]
MLKMKKRSLSFLLFATSTLLSSTGAAATIACEDAVGDMWFNIYNDNLFGYYTDVTVVTPWGTVSDHEEGDYLNEVNFSNCPTMSYPWQYMCEKSAETEGYPTMSGSHRLETSLASDGSTTSIEATVELDGWTNPILFSPTSCSEYEDGWNYIIRGQVPAALGGSYNVTIKYLAAPYY